MRKLLVLIVAAMVGIAAFGQDVDAIVDAYSENLVFETSRGEAEMLVKNQYGERTIRMIIHTMGKADVLVEYTSRAEQGQKILRSENDIYLYYPDASEIVRLQGAALRQSLQGSDVSYEDLTGGKKLQDTYDIDYISMEGVEGFDTHRLMFVAKSRDVPYPRQELWIDAETYVLRKSKLYSLSGRLIKEVKTLETRLIAGKTVATKVSIVDVLKKDTETVLTYTSLEVDIELDRNLFSLEELTF